MAAGVAVPEGVRREVRRRVGEGETRVSVAAEFLVSRVTVWRILSEDDPMPLCSCSSSSSRFLSLNDRVRLGTGLVRGDTFTKIASGIGCHTSTVSREVAVNGGIDGYDAVEAHRGAISRARRPKQCKLVSSPVLAQVVSDWLRKKWSPEQISGKLKVEFPDDEMMRVSKETIYQALYVYGRGGLKKELISHLRSRRTQRHPRAQTSRNTGRIKDMVLIADRPAEIEDRLVPGHWEGDLIIGANNRSQIGTLVERTSGLVMLVHLPTDRCADTVAAAIIAQIQTLPAQLRRSLTWDQGSEMADHADITLAADIAVYFCDPHAPWQRGSNENINGLLRQYFPKSTDLSVHSQADLDAVAEELNNRPRKRHNYMSPLEVFNQLVLQ